MKNNSNWKTIEEEFRKKFFWYWRGEAIADEILFFFKPYFQEKMHEEAVEELEIVDNNPKE